MMRVDRFLVQLVFSTIFILQALHAQLLRDYTGAQLRNLLQSSEPSGVLDLSNVDLSNVLPASGVPLTINLNNPLKKDTQDRRSLILESIIPTGGDTRIRVNDTLQIPFRSVGQVGSYCTGAVIGPRHVLTAANCLVDPFTSRQSFPVTFTPARNGRIDPFGTYEAESVFYPDEFLDISKDFFQYDYGVIILKQPFESDVLPLKIANPCDKKRNHLLNIIGYPADKKKGTQWTTACAGVWMNCEWRTFRHFCDTFGGMSGSPMMTVTGNAQNTEYLIRGVHSAGTHEGEPYNQGVIITDQIQETINQIIQTTS